MQKELLEEVINLDYNYVYQNGQLIAQEFIGEKKHFMLNDHKGTVQVVVNESGAKVEETFYSPFGEIISGGATSRFDYEGKEFDSVVGDYDYHARKVNPQWGMFTQPDTMLPNVYDPQQLNRYAFERNNPFKYVDRNGNSIEGIDTNLEAASYNLANGLLLAKEYFSLSKEAFSNKEYSLSINYGGQGASETFDATWRSFAIAGSSATAVYTTQFDAAALIKEVTPEFSSEMDEEQKRIIDIYYDNKNKELMEARRELSSKTGGAMTPNQNIQPTNPITAYTVLGSPKESKSGGSSSNGFKIVTLKGGATLNASPKMQAKLSKQGLNK